MEEKEKERGLRGEERIRTRTKKKIEEKHCKGLIMTERDKIRKEKCKKERQGRKGVSNVVFNNQRIGMRILDGGPYMKRKRKNNNTHR